jgi:hypothetical protein
MVNRVTLFALGSLVSLSVAPGAMAEKLPGHPRINEVSQRLAMQQHRIAEGERHGQIDRWRAMRDERRDARVARELVRDEAMHDGHITFAEQRRLNRELDRNSIHIEDQRRLEPQIIRP